MWDGPSRKPTRYCATRSPKSFSGRTIPLFIKPSMPKTSQRKHRQSRFEEGIRPFRYRFYAEMSHWDEKKLTRYRAKAGPEVVLRKVSVLFAISSMPKTSHKGRQGKVVLRRASALFRLSQVPYFHMVLHIYL